MKATTRANLITRLKDLGAKASMDNRTRHPPGMDLRSATTVSVPISLLDDLLDALVDGFGPRGRPRGKARLSHHAFVAAAIFRGLGGDKKELLGMVAEKAGLDKAQTRTLQIMVNEHLRRDQSGWDEAARKKWKLK
ncbi:hypothetical protein [Rhizobium mulingense]|uniref:hypothetical protein n=1 Tax=Rhizobium mulingense TaxID=3031128 RepID=UPI002B493E73|nr:hypothetical protein [Rhizobium sp. MJ21]MEB3047041.1 hypothetical protein [Rhizobium sp. MJ21]